MALSIPQEITVGEPTTVGIVNSSRANQKVYVMVSNDEGEQKQVEVQLDEHGNGTGTWTVLDWPVIHFNYSTCEEVTRYPITTPAPTSQTN